MKKYLINNEDVSEGEFNSRLEDTINSYCESTYDDLIDDTNEEICIDSLYYNPSLVPQRCDEITYRCWLYEYRSSELRDAQYQLNRVGEVNVLGVTFTLEETCEKIIE